MNVKYQRKSRKAPAPEEVRIRLDLTFDLPAEMAEQLELWGIERFDACEFDRDRCHITMSANTTLYGKGRKISENQKSAYSAYAKSLPSVGSY